MIDIKFTPFLIINTNRLILYKLQPNDAKAIYDYRSNKANFPNVDMLIYENIDDYELNFNELCDKDSWLKGRKGEYKCFVSTDTLSSEELLAKHLELFEYFRGLTGWRKDWEGK